MTRYIGPLIFLAAAVWVYLHNQEVGGSVLVFPMLDLIPGYEADIFAQGQLTWKILVGTGLVWLAVRVADHVRAQRATPDEDEDDA